MATGKVTRNYQVTLPRDFRKSAGINIGDEVSFTFGKDEARMRKVREDIIEKSAGIFTSIKGDSVDYVRKIREGSEKRRKRLGI